MVDVTVVLLDGGMPSTSLAPLEIFACTGTLWGMIMGTPAKPLFRVRTATIDGRKTQNFVPVTLEPTVSLADVRRTDLIVVPTGGVDLGVVRDANSRLIEWLARRGRTTAVAGICTGSTLLAAAGLLEGRPATTHWGVVDRARAMYPNVHWKADPTRVAASRAWDRAAVAGTRRAPSVRTTEGDEPPPELSSFRRGFRFVHHEA